MNMTQRQPLQSIYPTVRYDDARGAIDWLTSCLGFSEQVVYPGEGVTIAHAQLALGGNLIMLGSTKDDRFGVYIALDTPEEVDAHYARAKAAGAQIVRDLCDTEYGSREFGVRDPEGHLWSFGTYRPQAGETTP